MQQQIPQNKNLIKSNKNSVPKIDNTRKRTSFSQIDLLKLLTKKSPQKKQYKSIDNILKSKQRTKTIMSKYSTEKLPFLSMKRHLYGDKIFEKQSATTLQKTILSYSMPKAQRFPNNKAPSGSESTYYNGTAFKQQKYKGSSFGYGKRKAPYPEWMQRNMKQFPAPGSYEIKNFIDKKGPTFGIGYKFYDKVVVSKQSKSAGKLKPIKIGNHV